MSRKIQGIHEMLIGPIGQFQSVTKGVQIVKRGSLDAQTRKNATLVPHGDSKYNIARKLINILLKGHIMIFDPI